MGMLSHSACLSLGSPIDCSPPGSSVHGILQAAILEQAALPSSRGSSRPGDRTVSPAAPALAGRFFTTEPPGKPGREKNQPQNMATRRVDRWSKSQLAK